MIDGTYKVSMLTPIGCKSGVISFVEDNGLLNGSLQALGKENPIMDGKVNGNNFEFSGILKTTFSNIKYTANGTVSDDMLKATANTKFGKMQIEGYRV